MRFLELALSTVKSFVAPSWAAAIVGFVKSYAGLRLELGKPIEI